MKRTTFIILIFLLGCESGPQPINFGKDLCEFCKMTVMDKKFGAELINPKGKIQKFDSQECMLSYLKTEESYKAQHYFVINYANPGELLNAETAIYLHGGEVISPMGGNLAAFGSKEEVLKFQKELQGEVLSWEEVKQLHF